MKAVIAAFGLLMLGGCATRRNPPWLRPEQQLRQVEGVIRSCP